MATESGPANPPLGAEGRECTEIERLLREEPFDFEFFQAVRLIGLLSPEREPVGEFSAPRREILRFGASPDYTFPASQISQIDWPEGAQPLMRVNFMGLTGPMGLLPLYYSTLVRERLRAHDTALRDFFDIFNHRAISMFYRAWEKYRFMIAYERGGEDRFSHHLLDLIGMGTPGLARRQPVPDDALIFYAGLLSPLPRSAAAFEQLLADYFEVPVEVEQFVGAWHALSIDSQCRFSESNAYSEQLGVGAVVGDEVWDQQSGVRIRLGPLPLNQYLEFLPGGAAYEPLRALTRFFAGDTIDFEVQLVLRREDAPPCKLGDEGAAMPRLGWLTWARTVPLDHDPGDTVLRL